MRRVKSILRFATWWQLVMEEFEFISEDGAGAWGGPAWSSFTVCNDKRRPVASTLRCQRMLFTDLHTSHALVCLFTNSENYVLKRCSLTRLCGRMHATAQDVDAEAGLHAVEQQDPVSISMDSRACLPLQAYARHARRTAVWPKRA